MAVEKKPTDLIFTGDGFVERRTLDVKPRKELTKKQKRNKKDKAKYMEHSLANAQRKPDRARKWYGK